MNEGLPPGGERILYGMVVIVDLELASQSMNLVVTVDSCAGDEIFTDYCRVQEADENNNQSERLEIPPGTQPGRQFRLRGKGIPKLGGGGRGDHVVEAAIHIPKPGEVDDERRELLRRLAELEARPVKEGRGVLDRVKDLFGG